MSEPLSLKTDTYAHTARLAEGAQKMLANYKAFCLSLRTATLSSVGIWPDVFLVVLYCRVWWRELCPLVVVLARAPLTRWLRRWNMLIKLKTTSKNFHQNVTLVVSRATVRFIYGETCTCRHACLTVYLCVLFECVSCSQHGDVNIFEWLFDKICHCSTYLTAFAVISAIA